MYFSQTWNLTIAKNTYVNQRKSENHEELNFSLEKVQKYEKNWKSKNDFFGAEISLKKWWSQKTSPRGWNWGKFSKKYNRKISNFSFKNMKKTESPKMISKVPYELSIRSYERYKYFSQTWSLTIAKNTSVNWRKSKHHGEFNFSLQKILEF